MWVRNLKCFLVVVFFACAFVAGSGSVSTGTYDGASASASSSTGALEDAENISSAYDRHKGIRSYDSTGFPHDNNANRGVKSYGTPSGHGASHDHGIKGGGHSYNKNGDCSKCKWENDDYWERDEPEEEGDENDGDECDDGQYRPDKVHRHGPGTGHKPHTGSHPPGVYKTGPTGVYVDEGSSPGSPLGGINYPTDTGYSRPISGYKSTPKPGSSWSTPFADASKPGYGGVTAGAFGTTPSSWPDWNRGTTPGGPGSPNSPPAWDGGHGDKFPSSQRPGVPDFSTTTKPGQGWNAQFPSGSSSAIPHAGGGTSSPSSYENPRENQNRPYGQPGTQSTYAGAYAGARVTPGIGSPYGGASNVGRKDHPFGLYKPTNTQTSQRPYGGTDQAPSDSNYYGLGGYDKPGSSYSTPTTLNTFGTTKGPYGGIGSPGIVPGVQTNPFVPRKSPSGVYEHPGVTKPSYGSTTAWLGADQTGSGSSTWHSTPHAGFPTSNSGFGTTKTPFSHVNIPSPTLSAPYDNTGSKQPNFNVASSSATASAGTFPGTYRTPSITGTTTLYGTTPAYKGGSSYTPGVKGSVGNIKPAYGTVPHGSYPNIESSTWSGGLPESSTGPWFSGKPGDRSGITPSGYSPGIVPGNQPPSGSGTWPTGQPASGSGTWSDKQPGDGSRSSQVQPGYGSGPGCGPGRNCGGATSLQEGSNCRGCCGNYNCDNGCSGRGNIPAHELCGGIGPSGVNKTYYPAGTGDGNVPTIGTIYEPDLHLNTGANIKPVYPGATPGSSVTWNSANPFLYGPGGNTPSISHPWIETTDKPIGSGNPFLDSSWNSPKPGYSNAYNDRNVIPHEENTKPIGQGNLFLDGSNRKADNSANSNEGVIPLGGKIPERNNPFLTPLVGGSGGSGSSSYPNKSGTSGSFPGLVTPGNYPGSGTPGNYPGSGTPGNYPGSGTPGNYPGSGTPGNYPGSETPGNYPGSGTPGNYPGSGTPGNYPGSGTPGNYPGSGTPGNYPGSGTPGRFPEPGIPGNYPGSGTPGSGGYGGVKGGFHSGGAYPQDGNSDRSYPQLGGNPQVPGPSQCKLGLFGCGAPGSGSYADNKHLGGAFGGNVGTGIGNPGGVPSGPGNPGIGPGHFTVGVGNVPGGPGNPGIGPGHFTANAGQPGSGGSNLAASVGGAQARAYAGAFSSAQASSSSFANSFSGAPGSANNLSGNLSPNGAQNQGGLNSWASSGASAFASSSAGSWSGNHPVDVKG